MNAPAPRRAPAGFTLVEIMIALLIGMVAIVVIMQTYAVSEGFKRTSSSGSDAQTNGGIALYLLERELRIAGYGFNAIAANCTTMAAYVAGQSRSIPISPSVQINPAGVAAGDANTDVLLVAYGNADGFGIPEQVEQATGSQTGAYTVYRNYNAFRTGDRAVAFAPSQTCILTEITAVPSAAGNCSGAAASGTYNVIRHASGNYRNSYKQCANTPSSHNPAGGVVDPATGSVVPAVRYASGGQLFNLGPEPGVKAYAIRNGNLTMCDLLAADCSSGTNFNVVMNDIVSLRAVLGQDRLPAGNVDGVIDTWTRTTGNTIAVAVELTARTPLKEKPSGGATTCNATTNQARPDRAQDWFGPALTPTDGTAASSQINLSAIADWQCYRYKLFQTTVPVRNAIWTPTNAN
jgi:type IV pilus assembly protein PilW